MLAEAYSLKGVGHESNKDYNQAEQSVEQWRSASTSRSIKMDVLSFWLKKVKDEPADSNVTERISSISVQ